MSDYECEIAEFESARNAAMDDWFNARPIIPRNGLSESIFEAGFRMAWERKPTNNHASERKDGEA